MPLLVILVVKGVYEAICALRKQARALKPETVCFGCMHAHVQYRTSGRRAVSCTYGGALRAMALDVEYCTDFVSRATLVFKPAAGFVCQIGPLP